MRLKCLLLTSFLFTLFSTSVRAQAGVDYEKLDTYIEKSRLAWNIPGMAVAIVKDGKVVFSKGYGLKNIEKKDKVTEETLFAIASNSKPFTSAALAILVDEGRLNWDDKVRKYLPYFKLYDPYVSEEMTVRDLLCHRSGLATFSGDLLWYETNFSRKEVIQKAQYLKPVHGFRTKFGYSNIMYIAAGEVIQAVTDSTWEDYVEAKFLKPLGMKHTNTSIKYLTKEKNFAKPHFVEPGKKAVTINYMNWDNCAPAAGLNSSVKDMCNWLIMNVSEGKFKGKKIVSNKQLWEMQTPHTIIPVRRKSPNQHFDSYGLGWSIADYKGKKVLNHGGGADGMISKTVLIPEDGFAFVVLTNSINYLPSALENYILEDYMGTPEKDWSDLYLKYFNRSHADNAKKIEKENKERNAKSTPNLPLTSYEGTYSGEMYGDAVVKIEGGKLRIQFIPTKVFTGELKHYQYDTFTLKLENTPSLPQGKVNFILDADGNVEEMKVDIPNPDFDFKELKFMKKK